MHVISCILLILFSLFLPFSKAINWNQTPLLCPAVVSRSKPPAQAEKCIMWRWILRNDTGEWNQMTDGKAGSTTVAGWWKQDFTFSKYLTSYSVRLLLGYDGSLHTKVMLFCSIFSARSSLISDGAAERRRKRTEVCLGFNDFWTLDVLFTQSCAATVKWRRLKEKSIKRRRYWDRTSSLLLDKYFSFSIIMLVDTR